MKATESQNHIKQKRKAFQWTLAYAKNFKKGNFILEIREGYESYYFFKMELRFKF